MVGGWIDDRWMDRWMIGGYDELIITAVELQRLCVRYVQFLTGSNAILIVAG